MKIVNIERIKNDKLITYGVKYNELELLKLHKEIIKKCGIRKHVQEETCDMPVGVGIENFNIIRPSEPKILPNGILCDSKNPTLVEYDKIETPYIADLIDRIIDYDCNATVEDIDFLYNPNIEVLIKENDIEKMMEELNLSEEDKDKNRKLNLDNQYKYLYKLKLLVNIKEVKEQDIKELRLK